MRLGEGRARVRVRCGSGLLGRVVWALTLCWSGAAGWPGSSPRCRPSGSGQWWLGVGEEFVGQGAGEPVAVAVGRPSAPQDQQVVDGQGVEGPEQVAGLL